MQIVLESEDCREYLIGKVNRLAKELYGDLLYAVPLETLKTIVEDDRGSGKTTAMALQIIVNAIMNPRTPIQIVHDHGQHAFNIQDMRGVISKLIGKLQFKYLKINAVRNTITYDI